MGFRSLHIFKMDFSLSDKFSHGDDLTLSRIADMCEDNSEEIKKLNVFSSRYA